jgi:hypothetical protein
MHDDVIDVCARRRDAGPRQVEIRECRTGSVCNRPLPPPPPTPGPVGLNAGPSRLGNVEPRHRRSEINRLGFVFSSPRTS